jgi:hypothetical protein
MTTPQQTLPPENILRGALVGLIVVPLGVALWLLIWGFGFIASIVAFGVAFGAALLYRLGSGGRVGGLGALIITVTTVVTLAVAFYCGMVLDFVMMISGETGLAWIDILTHPFFNEEFALFVELNSGTYTTSALVSLGFAALGSFSTLRSVFTQSKVDAATPVQPAATPAGFETVTPAGFETIMPSGSGTIAPNPEGAVTPPAQGESEPDAAR